jgi:hypothetical protein
MDNHTELGSPPDTTYIYVTATLFYVIVFVFGVIGNILVIYVICALKDMRTPTNIFLLNLCLADLLVLLVCMPSSIIEFHTQELWYLGNFMCECFHSSAISAGRCNANIVPMGITSESCPSSSLPHNASYTSFNHRIRQGIAYSKDKATAKCPTLNRTQQFLP